VRLTSHDVDRLAEQVVTGLRTHLHPYVGKEIHALDVKALASLEPCHCPFHTAEVQR
jgi:hypothetical protein